MVVSENRFAPEGNEKKVIELLAIENATPWSIKKAKNGMKIFQGKKLENFILTIKHPS